MRPGARNSKSADKKIALRYPLNVRLSRGKTSLFARPWQQRRRVVLLGLIAVNVTVFVVQFFLDAIDPGIVKDYLALSDPGIHDAYAWQFATAILLHSSPWHLLGNVLILYFLGRDIESILGQRHFLYLYLSGAIAGELGHLFSMPSETVLYAASGGVAAILIAYATILPDLDLISWRRWRFAIHLKAKHFASVTLFLSLVMLVFDRTGSVMHSAIPGGFVAGWLYTDLLGFGHPSWLRRWLSRRRAATERIEKMTASEFITQEIDPLLEKISRTGMPSLTRAERRTLAQAREKVA